MTVKLVLVPLALVRVPVLKDDTAVTMGHIILEVTLIDGAILLYLLPFALPDITEPLAYVEDPLLHLYLRSELQQLEL